MIFEVITIFPQLFQSFLEESLIRKACEKKIIKVRIHDLRKFATEKHRKVDDRPYGGGLGMVLKIEPIWKAITHLVRYEIKNQKFKIKEKKTKIILFSPRGRQFNQRLAWRLSRLNKMIMICGRYEGVDERVAHHLADLIISIGPYDLMGGELAAMVVIETISRLIPGVVGKKEFLKERAFFEYPQYTRPEIFQPKKGVQWKVPSLLLSGNHQKIKEWREKRKKVIE